MLSLLPGVAVQLVQAGIAVGWGEGWLEDGELHGAAQVQHLKAQQRADVGPGVAARVGGRSNLLVGLHRPEGQQERALGHIDILILISKTSKKEVIGTVPVLLIKT